MSSTNEFVVEDDDSIQFVQSNRDYEQPSGSSSKKKSSTMRLRNFLQDSNSTFLADFDPEKSAREKRKLCRKNYSSNIVKSILDKKGIHRKTGLDLCDCTNMQCPGCNYNCPNCRGTKCGSTCRSGRKWIYQQIEHDGKDLVIFNSLLDKKYTN